MTTDNADLVSNWITHAQEILKQEGALSFSLRVRPHAPESRITGVLQDGSLKVSIAGIPEGGAANEEIIRFFTTLFSISSTQLVLLGKTSRFKKLVIRL